MRILYISSRSDIGGGPRQMLTLIKNYPQKDDVFCALPRNGFFFNEVKKIIPLNNLLVIPHRKFSLGYFFKLLSFCRDNRINIIHSHGKGAGLYSRLLGLFYRCSIVHTLHGFHDGEYSFLKKRIYYVYEKISSILTTAIICVSNGERLEYLKKTGVKDNVYVVVNGTDILGENKSIVDCKKISVVSRLTYQKNVREVIDVAALLNGYEFHLYGDGEEYSDICEYIKEKKLINVIMHGEVSEIAEHIKNSAVFLSTSRWEGLPLAPLEAMSCGLPIVLSNVPGNSDIVSNGENGFLYQLGDFEKCADLIKKATKIDRESVRAIHSIKYSSAKMCHETYRVYSNICIKQ